MRPVAKINDLYGQGSTIRGVNLTLGKQLNWLNTTTNTSGSVGTSSSTITMKFTQDEYNIAQATIERRLDTIDNKQLFPLRKNEYVLYTEDLIIQTIYGEQVKNTFLQNMVGINELIKDCQYQSKTTGYVKALDGRLLYSRSPHSALNLLLQGSAGVVAKQWMVNYHSIAADLGLVDTVDYKQQAFIHDEYDCICKTDKAHILAQALEEGAAKVTTDFSTNIPIKADAKIGQDWYECH